MVGTSWFELPVAVLALWGVIRGGVWLLDEWPSRNTAGEWLTTRLRLRRRPRTPAASRRPIEVVAQEARLLAVRVHQPPRGVSYAKYQGWVAAYDRLLSEGCAALELDHLLGVLEPGQERDRERERVESLLWLAGLRIDEAA